MEDETTGANAALGREKREDLVVEDGGCGSGEEAASV